MTGATAFQKATISGQINHDLLQKFLSLYPNRLLSILRPPDRKTWTTLSKHWPIPDDTIESAVAGKEACVWGLRWGQQTRYAVFDIDHGSKYRCALELQKLQTKLAAVELEATTYRSSDSGGWHCYVFLQEWADCGFCDNKKSATRVQWFSEPALV